MILFEEQLSQFSIFSILPDLTKNVKKLDRNELYANILENALRWNEKVKETFVGVFALF